MNLFNDDNLKQFIENLSRKLYNEIAALSDAQITNCDFDEYIEYFQNKYYIDQIELDVEGAQRNISEEKLKVYNVFYDRNYPYEQEYYFVDGYVITYHIPFSGNSDLLFLKPSTYIYDRFGVAGVNPASVNEVGELIIDIKFKKEDLLNRKDKGIESYVENQFNQSISKIKKMIGYINEEITQYNNSIHTNAKSFLDQRKKKAVDYETISKTLNIPMKLKDDAPNITPIKLKRVTTRPEIRRPTINVPKDYEISDSDYNNILNIIHSTCSAMEVTPKTFVKNSEEELRDYIIATLGTHYENDVTGETFRKNGKTDIQVLFENKAAFIGECKIWHGFKKFEEAITQLFGYTTWKDTKSALIIFNKDNKDFSSILHQIDKWAKSNTKQIQWKNSNMVRCSVHKEQENVDVQLTIAIYNLC